ncbi:MAG: hypothetical protein OXB93_05025 [Cytophagales bacterium]|nr:hypothetical protein [Cytophagales bacterium]
MKQIMHDMILSIFQKELSDESLNLHTVYMDHPQWTSLRSLLVLSEIERKTQCLVPPEIFKNSSTIKELANQIQNLSS